MNDKRKQEIADMVYDLTSDLNDEELIYAKKCIIFWQKERKRQDKELKKLEEQK